MLLDLAALLELGHAGCAHRAELACADALEVRAIKTTGNACTASSLLHHCSSASNAGAKLFSITAASLLRTATSLAGLVRVHMAACTHLLGLRRCYVRRVVRRLLRCGLRCRRCVLLQELSDLIDLAAFVTAFASDFAAFFKAADMFLAFALFIGFANVAVDQAVSRESAATRLAGLAVSTSDSCLAGDLATLFELALGDRTQARLHISVQQFSRGPRRRINFFQRTIRAKALCLSFHGRAGRFCHVRHACS